MVMNCVSSKFHDSRAAEKGSRRDNQNHEKLQNHQLFFRHHDILEEAKIQEEIKISLTVTTHSQL